ncbi:MAG: ThiF family adenylyltransferase [Planctomycetes bacterium]|nr:ThiF family adenylyltransferase [Planctomycetota bacterium]
MSRDERFSRQIRFAPLGRAGQERLAASTVLLVGAGALGTHLADTLVRAGIGRLLLFDRDVVEESNLQRQVLFTEAHARAGAAKAVAAAESLHAIDSRCRVEAFAEEFVPASFGQLPCRPDLILDGTDNFPTRYVLNDLAVRERIPWVYGGAVGAEGMAMAILPGHTPCLRCLIPKAPPTGEQATCETAGILAPVVQMVTAFQSAQALKILSGRHEDVARGVFVVDVWKDSYGLYLGAATRDPACASCGSAEFPALREQPPEAVKLCGRNAVQVLPDPGARIDLELLARHLRTAAAEVELSPYLLRFVAENCRFTVFRGGRALLFGVDTPERARVLYDRYVGAR